MSREKRYGSAADQPISDEHAPITNLTAEIPYKRLRIRRSRVRCIGCIITTLCCSALLTGTKLICGRPTTSARLGHLRCVVLPAALQEDTDEPAVEGVPRASTAATKWLNLFIAPLYTCPSDANRIRMMPTAIRSGRLKMLSLPGRYVNLEGY